MCIRDRYIGSLRCGDIIDCRVTHLEPFGCFVDIGCGIASLIPIDCISISRISHPSDRFRVGQEDVYKRQVANNYQFHTLNNKVQAPLLGDESQFSYQKDRFYVTRSTLNSGLQIFTLTSVTALYSMFFFVSAVLVLIFVMMTLSIFISAKRIAVSKTRIVDELVDAFNCVEQGNLNMRLHISTGDEFEIIGESYNMMLDSIKELIRQNNEKTRENMVAEIKQLESCLLYTSNLLPVYHLTDRKSILFWKKILLILPNCCLLYTSRCV